MLSGVGIICFAASYSIALVLELTRLLFRSAIRGAVLIGFSAAGLVAHSIYLYYQVRQTAGPPLSSEREFYFVAAWVLVAIYLILTYYHRQTPFGLFFLPLVLLLIVIGTYVADPQPFPREPASRVWGMIHGLSILGATVSVLVGFIAGLMYLYQARRLKHKRALASRLRLPSLEWMARINARALIVAMWLLLIGVASGTILNTILRQPDNDRLAWYDPIVWSTLLMLGWLVTAVAFSGIYRPTLRGRKVAYLTVVSFVFLVIALSVALLLTGHGGKVLGQAQRGAPDPQAGMVSISGAPQGNEDRA